MAQGDTPGGEARKRGEAAAHPPLGEWLRGQRKARGVGLDEIVESTKISVRYLEAIEEDRYDALPAPIFVRGFLREYARVVGLDADEVVNLYLVSRPAEEPAAAVAAAPAPPPNRSALVGYVVIVALLLGLFVGIAAAISYWFGREDAAEGTVVSTIQTADAPGATEPEAGPAVDPAAGEAIDQPSDATLAESAGEAEPDAAPPAPESASAPLLPLAGGLAPDGPAVQPTGPLRVVLDFQQDCWVEVVVDGRRRESELKAGGETLALEADDFVELTLGNAPAVRVEVDGRAIALPLAGSRIVRGLRIDRRGVTSSGTLPGDSTGT